MSICAQNYSTPLTLDVQFQTNPFLQMINNQLKESTIQGWLLYVIRSFLQVDFCFYHQRILSESSLDFFSFSKIPLFSNFKNHEDVTVKTLQWNEETTLFSFSLHYEWCNDLHLNNRMILAIIITFIQSDIAVIWDSRIWFATPQCRFSLPFCVGHKWNCRVANQNPWASNDNNALKINIIVILFAFLVLILQSTCFIFTTWKRKQAMEQQPHGACERTKTKQKQNQATSYWNWARSISDLARKQCNGIIKGCLSCLTSESKGRFLVKYVNVWLSMMTSHVANPIFFNKKNKDLTTRTLSNPPPPNS